MKLKLDLHVHCNEASGFVPLTTNVVGKLVTVIKAKGLDGIAITDHQGYDPYYGFRVREIVEKEFNNEVLIIPGQETENGYNHEVELYFPNKTMFRFLAHPGELHTEKYIEINNVQGIEYKNKQHFIKKSLVTELADKHNLLLMYDSDAHHFSEIGAYYNELDLEELHSRAIPGGLF